MHDIPTIIRRNEEKASQMLRAQQQSLKATRPQNSLDALEIGLQIDLKVGRYEEVVFACERMLEIALRCAPVAFEAIVKGTRKAVGKDA